MRAAVAECTVQGPVNRLDQLRDADGNFLSGTVNVVGYVCLSGKGLEQFPVRFGTIGGDFNYSWNWLMTLEGAPRTIGGDFFCHLNRLTSLVGVHRFLGRMNGTLFIGGNEIVAGGIGLLLVEGLTKIVTDQPAFEIINRYFGQGKPGLLRCQEALHEAGLAEHARL